MCVQREMMLVTCGTPMYYKGRRPKASSTSVWLNRTSPLGHPSPPHFSVYESHSVSLALTGRAVLMANPQRWLGAVWGRSKALTSVTVFSTARYKSVTPKKAGTWIRHGTEKPVVGKTYVACSWASYYRQLVGLCVACAQLCSDRCRF